MRGRRLTDTHPKHDRRLTDRRSTDRGGADAERAREAAERRREHFGDYKDEGRGAAEHLRDRQEAGRELAEHAREMSEVLRGTAYDASADTGRAVSDPEPLRRRRRRGVHRGPSGSNARLSVRALVTGATGFAGSRFSRHLASCGFEVRALARPTSDPQALGGKGIEIVTGDVRDLRSLENSMRGVDVVFHLAAIFREVGRSDAEYEAVNVQGTKNAVEAAAGAGVKRFVHCSTVGVHGDTGATPATEDSPLIEAHDSYNRTKLAAERWAREAFLRLGLSGTIVRPSSGYGPGEYRYLKLFRGIARNHFVMIGPGTTWLNLAYIDDLCEGLALAGTVPEAAGQTFLLGGETNVTVAELAAKVALAVSGKPWRVRIPAGPVLAAAAACEALCRPFGIEPPLHRRRVGFFTVNRAFDISKAKRVLGYRPRVSLDEGIQRMAAWYREQGLL